MRPIWSAAVFSGILSALCATVYFTAWAAIKAHESNPVSVAHALLFIAPFALPVAGVIGLVLGAFGGWVLAHMRFAHDRSRMVPAAVLVGGILGCIPPAIPRVFPPAVHNGGEVIGFAPCVIIGATCAGLWSLWWSGEEARRRGLLPNAE